MAGAIDEVTANVAANMSPAVSWLLVLVVAPRRRVRCAGADMEMVPHHRHCLKAMRDGSGVDGARAFRRVTCSGSADGCSRRGGGLRRSKSSGCCADIMPGAGV